MTTTTAATWQRNRKGEWVVYGEPGVVRAGEKVMVAKRSGQKEWVEIASTGKPFRDERGLRVYGYPAK